MDHASFFSEATLIEIGVYGLDWTAKSKTNLAYNLFSPAYDALTL